MASPDPARALGPQLRSCSAQLSFLGSGLTPFETDEKGQRVNDYVANFVVDGFNGESERKSQLQYFPADGKNQERYPADARESSEQQPDEEMRNRVVVKHRGDTTSLENRSGWPEEGHRNLPLATSSQLVEVTAHAGVRPARVAASHRRRQFHPPPLDVRR